MTHDKQQDSDDFYDYPKRNLDHMFEEYENGTRSIFKSLNRNSYEEESGTNAESDNEEVKPDITIHLSRNGQVGLDLTEIGLPSPENILRQQEENIAILRKKIKKGTVDDEIELAEALLEKIQVLMEWMEEDESVHLQKDIKHTFSELNKLIDQIKLETDTPQVTRLAIDAALQRGIFFFDRCDPKAALKSYSICMIEQNRLLQTQAGLEEEMAGVRLNIATCYDMLGDLEHVESYAREAIELFRIAKAHPDPDQVQFDKNNLDYYLAKTMLLLAHQFVEQDRFEEARPLLNESLELLENIVAPIKDASKFDDIPSLTIHDDIFRARQLLYQIDADKMTPDEHRKALKMLTLAVEKAIQPIGDEETINEYLNIQLARCEIERRELQYKSVINIVRETFHFIDMDSPAFKDLNIRTHLIGFYQFYILSYIACGRHKLAMRYIQTAIKHTRRNIHRIKKDMIRICHTGKDLPEMESASFLLNHLHLRILRIFNWIQLWNMLIQKAGLLLQHGVFISPESQDHLQQFQELIEDWVNRIKDQELNESYNNTLSAYNDYLKLKSSKTGG